MGIDLNNTNFNMSIGEMTLSSRSYFPAESLSASSLHGSGGPQ